MSQNSEPVINDHKESTITKERITELLRNKKKDGKTGLEIICDEFVQEKEQIASLTSQMEKMADELEHYKIENSRLRNEVNEMQSRNHKLEADKSHLLKELQQLQTKVNLFP